MRTKFSLIALVGALATACDFYKDDVPVVVNYTMDYIPNKSVAIDLGAFIENGNSKSFKLRGLPQNGFAQILNESFLVYAPNGAHSDHVFVEVFNAGNVKIGDAQINLEANINACGIAEFDYAEVQPGGELLVNLADNDKFCGQIREAVLMYTPFENAEGLVITIPPKVSPTDPNENSRIELRYKAPEGFSGTAKGLYVAGINIKEEYRNENFEELMLNPAEKFEDFIASLVEIKVK